MLGGQNACQVAQFLDQIATAKWLALDPFHEQRGLAASCQMFLQSMFNSFVAGMIAPALWGSTLTLSLGMGTLMLLGVLATGLHHRLTADKPPVRL